MRHVIVMVTSSYPRFPGDSVGTFMEPIATSVAARGHEVHVVAPWHPLVTRGTRRARCPISLLQVRTVRSAERVRLRGRDAGGRQAARRGVRGRSAGARAGLADGARVARTHERDGHARPLGRPRRRHGGARRAAAAARRQPARLRRLRGGDARARARWPRVRRSARRVPSRRAATTSRAGRSRSARTRPRSRSFPTAWTPSRFKPDPADRAALCRSALGVRDDQILVFTAGRLVRKKGFEYLDRRDGDACRPKRRAVLAIGGAGDLERELTRARVRGRHPAGSRCSAT